MGTRFWIRRFCTVCGGIFVALLLVERLKGHGWHAALLFGAGWALISTAVFVATRMYHASRGVACAMCKDMPEER